VQGEGALPQKMVSSPWMSVLMGAASTAGKVYYLDVRSLRRVLGELQRRPYREDAGDWRRRSGSCYYIYLSSYSFVVLAV